MADFNGDGALDLALAQNQFAVHPEDTRLDAGRGLILRGDGHGRFTPVSGSESGLRIYGEQRGAAAADYDEDGRADLVVSQNGADTVVLRNVSGLRGLRVRLAGPPANPDGISASIRPWVGEDRGATQAVTAGGGYWSQPGSVLVIGGKRPTAVEVRWPDGRVQKTSVPSSGNELRVDWALSQGQ